MTKKIFMVWACFSIFPSMLISQNYAELKDINLKDSISCIKAQSKIVECCNYLLDNPSVENVKSINAVLFVVNWMEASANFTFSINDKLYKIIESDFSISSRYYASLASTAIEKNMTEDNNELQFAAITKFLNYCELPKNQVKINKKLQMYIDAKNNNSLKDLIFSK